MHLEQCYHEKKLKEEVKMINKLITISEFHFFSKKRERTESLPSSRHVGHYKWAAADSDLYLIHTTMINIGLINGLGQNRWKRCVYIMIEKVKGVSRINKLRIIQLFEIDLNFCLEVIFGDQLIYFAMKQRWLNSSQYGSKKYTYVIHLSLTKS